MGVRYETLLKLKRWNTPAVYNGWEAMTSRERLSASFNREEVRDFMPGHGSMIGYAVTVVTQPSDARAPEQAPGTKEDYWSYVAAPPFPKIVVVQDRDKPQFVGAFWGEVNSNIHRALGCVGTITDGAIRDLDEMTGAGFKALASRLCVGHAYAAPVDWNCPVSAFGTTVAPGDLIHADQHGFLVIPRGDEEGLLEAVQFMDDNENDTMISAAQHAAREDAAQAVTVLSDAAAQFGNATRRRFSRQGEW